MRDVRFIVLNADTTFGVELRATLLGFDGVRIVAEVSEAALIQQAIKQIPADVVLINLDPVPEAILPIAGEIVASESGPVVFAISAASDGPLILKAMRMGLREFLPKPIDVEALGLAIERVAATRLESDTSGKLITVLGSAGGIGATVVATNLAVELAQLASGGVSVVDMDYRFGQTATLLDVDCVYSLADLCDSPEQLEVQVVERALVKHASGVRVLGRPAQIAQADTLTASACTGVLSAMLQINEYVVTDGPTRFDLTARSVLDLSDVNLLLVQLLVPSVRNALRMLESMRDNGFNLDRTHVVCNRLGIESGHLSVQDVESTLGVEAFATIPDDWATVSGATNLGEPLLTHSPKSKVRGAIEEIARRLHSSDTASDDTQGRKKGLFGRIFAGT